MLMSELVDIIQNTSIIVIEIIVIFLVIGDR